ncbi:Nif3-like dinuclear metal center hexameric protein [Sediminibacillus albus]|uniref:GTP cyclohydrolase 1 type 2 homolog n=1 Tax=Sediminibacillus albus TaxID=407036 RepID=A0A1G9CR68_9BACI|nr:Nif3-like dinuclear metal center hexameric protein [Sediminibacillus albus]SDK54117.1 dinuclear metal center protein, YbgI/SA1388 family [Sediminibacillus albus]
MNGKLATGKHIIELFEAWSPQKLAYDWDNVGLQVGTLSNPVNKVMVTLDVLENVVDEAIEADVNLIIAHHPLLFKSLKQINLEDPKGKVIEKLIKNNITVYAAHTNLDITRGGVSDILADKLGIKETSVLVPSGEDKLVKVAVFVPVDYTDSVREAMAVRGAGYIGNYSHCSFRTVGEGTFKPQEGTQPFIGSQDELARVEEEKLETIIPKSKLSDVLTALTEAHPYEEPAYDILPLENKGKSTGVGRLGNLPASMSLQELSNHVKTRLDVPTVRVVGNLEQEVRKIAVLGGSGEDFINQAYQQGADVYITGDLTFHEAQDAWQAGLNIIDPGHHVEKFMKQAVKDYLQKLLQELQVDTEVIISKANTEPFHFI